MPDLRTEISEIVTGVAMLGFRDLDHVLAARPHVVTNVDDEHFGRLRAARDAGQHASLFDTAWDNGVVFARSAEGLRGRPVWRLEWKGGHKPPGYEQIPADLRVDHVYLVSCKYGSSILHNVAPSHLFDRRLAERRRGGSVPDWYADVAPEAYQELYGACREGVDVTEDGAVVELPELVSALAPSHRDHLKVSLRGRSWPNGVEQVYRDFSHAVALRSVERWKAALPDGLSREEMLWRLLRLQAAPYFVLGAAADGSPLRYRVDTPWDFRARFRVRSFDAWPDAVGQPLVRWRADVHDREADTVRAVDGRVEIRWSHGRFSGAPEAKVHLDTHPHEVTGYVPLS
jgi:hypothetical protein